MHTLYDDGRLKAQQGITNLEEVIRVTGALTMTVFSYQAVTAEGESRDGQIEASDKATAVERLQKQG